MDKALAFGIMVFATAAAIATAAWQVDELGEHNRSTINLLKVGGIIYAVRMVIASNPGR